MRVCDKHWADLKQQLVRHGYGDYLTPENEDRARLFSILAGEPDLSRFCPVLASHNNLIARCQDVVVGMLGNHMLLFMNHVDTPDKNCPMCFVNWMIEEHLEHCTNPDCSITPNSAMRFMRDSVEDTQTVHHMLKRREEV